MSKHTPRKVHPFPSAAVDVKTLFALRGWLASVLVQLGVRAQDLDDVVSDLVSSAYIAAVVGRYRPDPAKDACNSLKSWLYGFCWRKASHYHGVAWRRREIPHADPAIDEGTQPHDQLDARAALRLIAALPAEQRELLVAAADRSTLVDYARAKGWTRFTTFKRLRRARRAFIRGLRRRLW